MIGEVAREGQGISVLAARHDDDNLNHCIHLFITSQTKDKDKW